MTPEYIYLIVAVVLLAVVAIFAISRYKKVDMSIELPGGVSGTMSGETEGEPKGESEQPPAPQQASGSSAKTTVGGDFTGGSMTTTATGQGGQAEAHVKGSVKNADILTEV